MWYSVKDYAEMSGKSRQAVLKAVSKGKMKTREVEHPNIPGRKAIEIFHDNHDNHDNHKEDINHREKQRKAEQGLDSRLRGNDGEVADGNEGGTVKDYLTVGEVPADQTAVQRTADLSCEDAVTPGAGLSLVVLSEKADWESFPQESREVAFARLEIVKTWIDEKEKAKIDGIKVAVLEKSFLKQLKTGKICAEASQRLSKDGAFSISIRTIYRWEKSWKDHDSMYPISLADKFNLTRNQKDQQYVRTYIQMHASDPRMHSVYDIMRHAEQEVPGFDISYRTVARIVQEARKDKFVLAAMTGPTAWKNEGRPHIRRINDCAPGDKWESDGKTMNVLVMSPFWFHNDKSLRYLVRPVMVAWLDVATWTITGWATWLSESFHLVRTSFVDAIGKCGVPRNVTYDGGGAFHNIYTDPLYFAERKRETVAVKKARALVAKGYRGFYEQLGVEKRTRTIPGNSESKQIEPAWGDIFSSWEKRQFAYVGKDFTARPEWMRMTNLKLMKTYKDKIMTWDEYVSSVGEYINEWNNRQRPSLKRLDGSIASPIECYMEFEDSIRRPAKEVVEHVCWHPRKTVVQRDGVYIDGLLYRHPAFGVYLGKSVLVEYDERNRFECTIATATGEKLAQAARLVIPGMHMDAEQSQAAMIDRAHYEKELKAVYLARVNQGDAMTMQEFNSLTARVDLLMQDQSRRQETDKSQTMIQHETKTLRNKATKALEYDEFPNMEDELEEVAQAGLAEAGASGYGKQGVAEAGASGSGEKGNAEAGASGSRVEGTPDEDDELIAEINKDLNTIGIRSIT